MRSDLERLLRDVTLMTLAFAIALGWALYQVANGFGYLVVVALQRGDGAAPPLSFTWGSHIFVFSGLLLALTEFGLVLAVVLAVRRWVGTRPAQ